jgi:hypothetical protein
MHRADDPIASEWTPCNCREALVRLTAPAAAFLPGIKEGAAYQLASTRSPEFLPYLIVMLGSPSPSTRDLALISF